MDGLYYRHSGKFSVQGAATGLAAGLASGLVLAFIYSYLILYIPFVYVNFLLTAGFGSLLGGITARFLRRGKLRNTKVALLMVIIVATASLYASWVVWIYAFIRRQGADVSLLPIASQPRLLWQLIQRVNEVGAWSFLHVTPTGPALGFVWIVEASMILGFAIWVGAGAISEPFCESCQRWCELTEGVAVVGEGDPKELKSRMEKKDFSFPEKLGAKKPGASSWFRLDLHSCPQCGMVNTLSIRKVRVSVDKKGKSSEKTKNVMSKLLLNAAETESLRRLSRTLAEPGSQ